MSEDRVEAIDAAVAGGVFPSRASMIVAAIDRLVAELERETVDRAIVGGYTRVPPATGDARWAEASARRSVAAEPW